MVRSFGLTCDYMKVLELLAEYLPGLYNSRLHRYTMSIIFMHRNSP